MRELFRGSCYPNSTTATQRNDAATSKTKRTTQPHWAPPSNNRGGNKSFFGLMQLPGELRNMIWEFAMPTDRILVINAHGYYVHSLPPPAIAWVCHESRSLALYHGRAYALFDKTTTCELDPSRRGQPTEKTWKTWTWFSPAFDRVLLALMNNEVAESQLHHRAGLSALGKDVRHMLVQPECFYPGIELRFGPEALLQTHVFRALACFPSARTVGVVRACFNVVPWRESWDQKTRPTQGEEEEEEEEDGPAARPPLYYYRPLRGGPLHDADPQLRLLSNPAHIRAVEEARVQRTAPCTCHCESDWDAGSTDRHDEEENDEDGHENGDDKKPPPPNLLWQRPPQTTLQSRSSNQHNRGDHGLARLWSPPDPHDGSWELWRVMKMWIGAQDKTNPLAHAERIRIPTSRYKLPAARRAWISRIAGRAPHVYSAEMIFYGNGYFSASAIPRCVRVAPGGGIGCGLLGGKIDLGVEILMRI
ncbi:hypothetical protein PG996_006647 [Apiospora saccharicola]|uniref:2EXR domain-containing protein n=1 Tax=Apiospora saccharicola TaxID=335842 RepID=A0ABR1VBB0_9PEZI